MKITGKFIATVLRFIGKYLVPFVCGFLEGDNHIVTDAVSNFF